MTTKKLTDYLKQQTPTQSSSKTEQAKPAPTRIRFKKETEFQESQIGKIPKDWKVCKLGQIVSLRNGQRPSLVDDGNIPVYGANGIMGYTNKYMADNEYTLIIGRVGAVGRVHLGRGKIWISDNAIFTEHYDRKSVFLPFLYYSLITKRLERHASRTTHPLITQTFIENLEICLPSIEEQKAIVEILSTVDYAIEKVRLLIDRAERLKKGLMQELLTKGIGHKEFQETPIGKIPKEWSIARLNEIATIIMGQSPPSDTYNDYGEGLPFLQGKEEFGLIHPTPRLYTIRPTKIAEPGDILIAVRAPVGDVNIAPFKLCIGRGLAALRFNKNNRAHYLFYFYYLQHIKPRIESLGKGTTFKAITKEDLENLLVPVPSLEEQVRISEVLYELDRYLLLLKGRQAHLERVKKGLMDTLLTGRVRVIAEPS